MSDGILATTFLENGHFLTYLEKFKKAVRVDTTT